MNRRGFLTAAAASIFVPQFGRFFREGSGRLWTPDHFARDKDAFIFRAQEWHTLHLTKPGDLMRVTGIDRTPYWTVEVVDMHDKTISLRRST